MEDPTALGDGLLPLWPFQTADQVEAWRRHRLAVGGSPHHRLDPAQTALEFTRGALGLTSVDRITYVQADGGTTGASSGSGCAPRPPTSPSPGCAWHASAAGPTRPGS